MAKKKKDLDLASSSHLNLESRDLQMQFSMLFL